MANFTTKQYDTRNVLKATLLQNGTALDLTDCTVNFVMENYSKNEIINRNITVHDRKNGVVWVVFTSTELQTYGTFKGEFEVTFNDGRIEHFPNQDYIQIKILPSL